MRIVINKQNIFVFCVISIIMSCSKKDEKTTTEFPQNAEHTYEKATAQIIKSLPGGMISTGDNLKVTFHQAQYSGVKPVIKTGAFSFTPEVQGSASWEDETTLIFVPAKPLIKGNNYTAILDTSKIQLSEPHDLKVPFSFYIVGQIIKVTDSQFNYFFENNPNELFLTVEFMLTEAISSAALSKAITFTGPDGPIPFLIEPKEKDFTFSFRSEKIYKEAKEKKYTIVISKSAINLEEDFSDTFILEALQKIKVTEVAQNRERSESGLRISFSDTLDIQQKYDSYITISPEIDFSVKTIGSDLYINGDFECRTYSITIKEGLPGKWSSKTTSTSEWEIKFEDIFPQITFDTAGFILPTGNNSQITFSSVNVRHVVLKVIRVFDDRMFDFLKHNRLNSYLPNYRGNPGEGERIGEKISQEYLDLGHKKNTWKRHLVDLSNILNKEEKGLYYIEISFSRNDMLYDEKKLKSDRSDSQPGNERYIFENGRIYKPIIISDLGVTVKKAGNQYKIFVMDIPTVRPVSGAKVTLSGYNRRYDISDTTDGNGVAQIQETKYNSIIQVEYNTQITAVSIDDMKWNTSSFQVEGVSLNKSGIDAFIYTERGVYRPGDPINLTALIRQNRRKINISYPVTIELENPKGQTVFEKKMIDNGDGFYTINFETKPNDPTGNWYAYIKAADITFTEIIKVETVIANRLKVDISTEKENYIRGENIKGNVISKYLFGTPSKGLNCELKADLKNQSFPASQYKDFFFNHEGMTFEALEKTLFSSTTLNDDGMTDYNWELPLFDNAPSAVKLVLKAKVFEKGGRFTDGRTSILYFPHKAYVGVKKMELDWGYLKVNTPYKTEVIYVDTAGKPIAGEELTYTLYNNTKWWWWEYRDQQNTLKFKTLNETKLLTSGKIISSKKPRPLSIPILKTGQYLLEIKAKDGSHINGIFFHASYWGALAGNDDSANHLTLKSDKNKYFIGEKASISFPAPQKGKVLITIEKGEKIENYFWKELNPVNGVQQIEIPITQNMLPNAYISASVIQLHSQTSNDLPMRMYGVIPLLVEDPESRDELEITSEELRPDSEATVFIKNKKGKETTFTLAIVDEGLLSLTDFRTPNPWNHFFKKERHQIDTWDLYSCIIGAVKGDIFSRFSIGGDYDSLGMKKDTARKAKRFEPVCIFKGPFKTDSSGNARISFKMPQYIGAVRLMAVSASTDGFGSASITKPVKKELMLFPTLPRVISPLEKFTLPVTVFAMENEIGGVTITLKTTGPLTISGTNQNTLSFTKSGDGDVHFNLETPAEAGIATISITAKSEKYTASFQCEIDVRPSSPRIYQTVTREVTPGNSTEIPVPDEGIKGTGNAKLVLSAMPDISFSSRLYYLIRYPYGCLEQTTSAVFPQLFLSLFLKEGIYTDAKIDDNINQGIDRCKKFLTSSGGFAFWPGNTDPSPWGNNYTGHFLLEAKAKGFHVPDSLLDPWLRYQSSRSRYTDDDLMSRVYRVYLLAMANHANYSAMNMLKQNSLKQMNNVQKWLLAGAYQLAGSEDVARSIAGSLSTEVDDYKETGGSYGSQMRDRAIIMTVLILFDRQNEAAQIFKELARNLSTKNWYSTQTTAYALLAMGKYMNTYIFTDGKKSITMKGNVKFSNGSIKAFNTSKMQLTIPLADNFSKSVILSVDSDAALTTLFAVLEHDSIPLTGNVSAQSKNLSVSLFWLDDNGNEIDPAAVYQGFSFYGKLTVKKTSSVTSIEEIALCQLIPAGWEIENMRLLGDELPHSLTSSHTGNEEYMDIRDDRIHWFFDITSSSPYEFIFKVIAVTAGEFMLPPTQVEAMYDHDFLATLPGYRVKVNRK